MRKAVIKDGKVENIIKVDPENLPDRDDLVDETGARIGDDWDGTTFTTPAADPMEVWQDEMNASDFTQRNLEEFIDAIIANGLMTKDDLPNDGSGLSVGEKYDAKKIKRAEKPS